VKAMRQIEEICELAVLVSLADEWWDLWHRSPAATPFQSPAWLLAWWIALRPHADDSAVRDRGGWSLWRRSIWKPAHSAGAFCRSASRLAITSIS